MRWLNALVVAVVVAEWLVLMIKRLVVQILLLAISF